MHVPFLKYSRLSKFLVSGVLAALTEYSVFIVLYSAVTHESYLAVCQTISFLVGFFVSFKLNRRWVFNSQGNAKDELTRYAVLAIINLFLTNIFIWLMIHEIGLKYWVSKLCIMAMVATWNYLLFSRLIFTNKT